MIGRTLQNRSAALLARNFAVEQAEKLACAHPRLLTAALGVITVRRVFST
jgi:hypothetical protein